MSEQTQARTFTFRAFLVGTLLSIIVVVMSQYSVNVIHGSYLSIDHMPAGGIFLFFVLVCALLPAVKCFCTRWDFSAAELIVVYVMILVTSSIATMGLGSQFLAMLAGPFYFATPENRWTTLIHPHIRPWFVPTGEEAIRQFFEGAPEGQGIPWGAWARPMAVWVPFIFCMYFVMICTGVLLRRQWVQRERLIFPLVRLPMDMSRQGAPEDRVRPFFKSKLMWVGFAVPFLISCVNALHHYYEFAPNIKLVHPVPLFEKIWTLQFRISFPIIGFAYFINVKTAFGLWFFNLLAGALRTTFKIMGYSSQENMGTYGAWSPIFKHLGMGAFLTMVFYGLWAGRVHLRDVLRKAIFGAPDVDDSDEILSYRVAFWGWVLGILFMALWLKVSGLPFWISIAFVLLALLIFVGVTRVVAEGGLPTLIAPSIAPSQLISAIGCAPIGPAGLATLGFTYIWCSDIRTFVMSSATHGLKLSDEIKGSRRPLFWAMAIAVVVGVLVSSFMILTLAYEHGGVNLNNWYFWGNSRVAYTYVAQKIDKPSDVNALGWACKGIGAAAMGVLMFMQRNFLWWPLHPLGFAIGANGWLNNLWFSIFLAWLIKSLVLRYGGHKLFTAGQPLFLGFVLGQYSAAGVWVVIDCLTGMVENRVFWI